MTFYTKEETVVGRISLPPKSYFKKKHTIIVGSNSLLKKNCSVQKHSKKRGIFMEFMAFVLGIYLLGIAYIRFTLEKEQKELVRKACLSHPYSAKYLRKNEDSSNLLLNQKTHIKTVLRGTASNIA